MQTVSRVYDTHSQARDAVNAIEKAGVPASEISLVANKHVSEKYADVDDVSKAGTGAGVVTTPAHAAARAAQIRATSATVIASVIGSESTRAATSSATGSASLTP